MKRDRTRNIEKKWNKMRENWNEQTFAMFSSLFGFSKNEDVVHKEKVDGAIQEARIVKDFYERYWLI